MVYVIEAIGRGIYKIGHGVVKSRLCSLQTGCPDELKVALEGEGGFVLERRLHARYDHRLVRGEWFALTGEDLDEIRVILSESDADTSGYAMDERTVTIQKVVVGKKDVSRSFLKQLPKLSDEEASNPDRVIWGWILPEPGQAMKVNQRLVLVELNGLLFTRNVLPPGTIDRIHSGSSVYSEPHSWAASEATWEEIEQAGQIFV